MEGKKTLQLHEENPTPIAFSVIGLELFQIIQFPGISKYLFYVFFALRLWTANTKRRWKEIMGRSAFHDFPSLENDMIHSKTFQINQNL